MYISHSCMIVDNVIKPNKNKTFFITSLKKIHCNHWHVTSWILLIVCRLIIKVKNCLHLNYVWQIFLHVVIFKLYWKLLYKLRAQDEYCCLSIVNRWLIVGFFKICPCRKQKSKAYLALQALETDLNSLAQLQRYDVLFTGKKNPSTVKPHYLELDGTG